MIMSFLFKAFIIYVMGGLISVGIYYSSMSFFVRVMKGDKYIEDLNVKRGLFIAFILSWISVGIFIQEFYRGLIKAFNEKNDE